METFSSYEAAPGENGLENSLRKRSLPKKKDGIPAQERKIINLDDLKVSSTPKKRATMKRSSTSTKIVSKSAKKSSDGNRSQQCSETSAARPPVIANVEKKKPENQRKRYQACQRAEKKKRGPQYNPVLMTVSLAKYCLAVPSHQFILIKQAEGGYSAVINKTAFASWKLKSGTST